MTPPAWAYHVDNFDPPPDDELVCSVCRGVFCDPVQSPCNHVFCRNCLTKWLETSRTCPICRKRTTRVSIQEVVPLIKNMIMKLTLNCRHSEHGCTEKFSLEGCESHMKVCTYEMVKCKNRPCKLSFMRKDIRDHELKTCPHRYVRCKTCYLKVSSRESSKHNCIKALKRKLKMKDEDLKKKTKKIKELQDEIKSLKEVEQESSDQSSVASTDLSAADIMIDFFPSPSFHSSSNPSSADDSNSYITDSEEEAVDWFDDFLDSSEASNYPLPEISSDHIDDSIEYPRSSVSEAPEGSLLPTLDILESPVEDEPLVRRPIKRRHATQILDTTDEDNEPDLEPQSVPSPKRNWIFRNGVPTQSDSFQNGAGPSHVVSSGDALTSEYQSTLLKDGVNHSNNEQGSTYSLPFKLRPRLKKRPAGGQTRQTITPALPLNGSPVFERTLAMLEQYNLESDPEWLPSTTRHVDLDTSDSDCSTDNGAAFLNIYVPSSYESSLSDSVTSNSSGDYVGAHHLLYSFRSDTSDDDPDWNPN